MFHIVPLHPSYPLHCLSSFPSPPLFLFHPLFLSSPHPSSFISSNPPSIFSTFPPFFSPFPSFFNLFLPPLLPLFPLSPSHALHSLLPSPSFPSPFFSHFTLSLLFPLILLPPSHPLPFNPPNDRGRIGIRENNGDSARKEEIINEIRPKGGRPSLLLGDNQYDLRRATEMRMCRRARAPSRSLARLHVCLSVCLYECMYVSLSVSRYVSLFVC